ncbi:MAG: inosine/xanthosine triphosphatase [Archaeoglobaceae archaeon]
MKVVVGSRNPTKIEGVRKAFEYYFKEVEVEGFDVKTSIPPQPFDFQTIIGAVERAKICWSKEFDFSVGIEAGLFKVPYTITGYLDFQVAAVFDGKKIAIGFGPGFEYPPVVIKEVLEGKEVGSVMEKFSGIKDIGKKIGAVYFLSKGAISRVDLTKMAVLMALIPFINNYEGRETL